MTLNLYVASYAHRYSDPCGGYVGFTAEAVEATVEAAMQYEADELRAYCEHETPVTAAAEGCNAGGRASRATIPAVARAQCAMLI